ncbi:MAG: hypothetical protein WA578_18795 [Candidatus Sulfotelmatobacter sp.]
MGNMQTITVIVSRIRPIFLMVVAIDRFPRVASTRSLRMVILRASYHACKQRPKAGLTLVDGRSGESISYTAAAIYPQFSKLRRERRLCAEGQVICGSLVSKNIDLDHLTMRYRFRAPGGFTIESESEGSVKRSNWSYDSQFFPDNPNLVAVLFLSETEFYLL